MNGSPPARESWKSMNENKKIRTGERLVRIFNMQSPMRAGRISAYQQAGKVGHASGTVDAHAR